MIQTNALTVRYGSQVAIREASMVIERGSITAIMGPSGCGKSSFLSALNRMTDLIPGAQVSGQVLLNGCDIYREIRSPAELRRRVGMIFQKPNPFPMSIQRNIQLALREHGTRNQKQLNKITQQVLENVGLWDEVKNRLNHSATQLSGGQQQRLCIARALALEPQVLLMDEPCSALDPIAAGNVESLIKDLRAQLTIVIVTHNLAQARRIADHAAVFWTNDGGGEIIEQGTAENVFTSTSNSTVSAYLSGLHG